MPFPKQIKQTLNTFNPSYLNLQSQDAMTLFRTFPQSLALLLELN